MFTSSSTSIHSRLNHSTSSFTSVCFSSTFSCSFASTLILIFFSVVLFDLSVAVYVISYSPGVFVSTFPLILTSKSLSTLSSTLILSFKLIGSPCFIVLSSAPIISGFVVSTILYETNLISLSSLFLLKKSL